MEITVGQIVEGKITGITNFGVFVDLGEGKSGMVHISEVSRTYVNDIKEHVKIGDEVNLTTLIKNLIAINYKRVELVSSMGEFSVKGDVVDIYLRTSYPQINTILIGN